MESILQDVQFALRLFRKSAGITVIAVVVLALGIGANTAIFSIVNAVMLRPLPYPSPERLVQIGRKYTGGVTNTMSVPNFRDYREQAASAFETMSAYDVLPSGFNMATRSGPERVSGLHVTANFFQTLGVQPQLGRSFAADEDQLGHDNVV